MTSLRSATESGIVDHRQYDASFALPVVPKLDTAGVNALQSDDIVVARNVLAPLSAADRFAIFCSPLGTTGQVPLLAAAARGATHMMGLFAGMGASLNVQSPTGFDGVYMALFNCKEKAAGTLLRTPGLVSGMTETSPFSAADVRTELLKLSPNPTDSDLDALADKLTNCGTKLLTTTDMLGVYLAHMNDAKDSPFASKAESWNPEGALQARVRTLLGLIVTTTGGEDRSALINEVAEECEAIRLDRRIYSIGQTKDPEVHRLALERECDRILTKLKNAVDTNNPLLTTMVIPVATPLHTMFMSLDPCYIAGKPHVVFHYDNRGFGHDAHTKPTKGKVFPLRTAVPATPEMYAELRKLLITALDQRGNGSVDGVYDGIREWLTTITVALGPDALEDPSWRDLPDYAQVAGNCSLANQEPGIERRLGVELALKFHSFEQADVRRRLLNSVTPERVDAWLTETSKTRVDEQMKLDLGTS